MAREGDRPYTRTHRPEPHAGTKDWVIWAAWADRVSFDEIKARSGYAEQDVIRLMRLELKPSSFRLWRKRVTGKGTKHLKRFEQRRRSESNRDLSLQTVAGDESGSSP